MGILDWFSPTRIIILLVLAMALIASVLGYGEVRHHAGVVETEQRYDLAITKMQAEAATKLAAATKRALELERTIATMQAQKEADYEKKRNDSRAASQALADSNARNGGRMFDPAAQRGCSGPGAQDKAAPGAGGGAGAGTEAGGLLSEPLTRLLERITGEAQAVNDAYGLCRGTLIDWQRIYNAPDP